MEEEKKVSKFSSGLNIIMRLDILWKNCQKFKREGKYSSWNDELDTIWLELARDIDEVDLDNEKDSKKKSKYSVKYEEFKKFDERLRIELPFEDNLIGFNRIEKDTFKRRNNQYKILMEKQLFLARLENEVGKGTSWGEQEDD